MNLLLNKYQPKSIDEINLNLNTNKLLKELIKINKLNLLIVGSINSGKFSLINIILNNIYESNGKDYRNDNILYINLLKDQGLNYYKNNLKNFCETLSINNIKKTIIIEDLDIFNEHIQTLFYNVINKYPDINFIISTNSILKIHNSIIDLLEIIEIEKIKTPFLLNIINNINKKENLNLQDKEINYLIKISNHSISNLINYIQKIVLLKNKQNSIYNLDSNIIIGEFNNYFELCKQNKYKDACNVIINIINNGFSIIDILESIIIYLKTYDTLLEEEEIFKIIKIVLKYINIFYNIHEDDIELYFLTKNIIDILANN